MKKFFGLLLMLMMIASNCLAMTFSQPVELGGASVPPDTGFNIRGSSQNNGNVYKTMSGTTYYGKGIAIFGNGNDKIYFHYNAYLKYPDYEQNGCRWGGNDIRNTFSVPIYENSCTVYKIPNDSEIKFYAITRWNASGSSDTIIIGKKINGTFVKYIDTKSIVKSKFNSDYPYLDKCNCRGDTVVISYKRGRTRNGFTERGEFRFKWDDKAQWFGVEQVVY